MNTKRIPMAIVLMVVACTALVYVVGSLRPFAPSEKFSNAPPTTTAVVLAAFVPPATPSYTPSPLPSQSPSQTASPLPSDTPSHTPSPLPSGSPSNTTSPLPSVNAQITRAAPTLTDTPTAVLSESESAAATQTSILAQKTFDAISVRAKSTPQAKKELADRATTKTTNFLLVGTDTRIGDPNWQPNTDVMMVLFLDTLKQRAALLSLPRDLVVAIPGQQAFRINSAYHSGWQKGGVAGGVEILKQILRDDMDIRIDHWALIDFNGLNKIVDTLGGIEVSVPCPLTDTIDQQAFTIPMGTVTMDSLTVKRYVQSRYTTSDTSRNYRQQRVVWAMAKKALQLNAPDRVPLLYEQLKESVTTDMTLFDMVGLVPALYQLDLQNHPEHLHARVLEPPAVYPWIAPTGAWLYMPNYDVIQTELDGLFDAPEVALPQATESECPAETATPPPTDSPTVTPTGTQNGTPPPTDAQIGTPPQTDTVPVTAPTDAATTTPPPTDAQAQTPSPTLTDAQTVIPPSTEVPSVTPTP